MKYFYCRKCADVRRARMFKKVTCYCGESWGVFTDFENATFGGYAVPLGIPNHEFWFCLMGSTETFVGWRYGAAINDEHVHLVENAALKLESSKEIDMPRLTEYAKLMEEGLLRLSEDGERYEIIHKEDNSGAGI